MKKDVLTKKVLCSLLLAGTVGMSNMAFANSGGSIVDSDYVGSTTSNSNVVIDSNFKGDVYGGKSDNDAVKDNTVTITNGAVVNGNVYGGYVNGSRPDTGALSQNNTVIIEKGAVIEKAVIGGKSFLAASENNIFVDSSTVKGGILGGYSKVKVNSNTVTITNSKIYAGELNVDDTNTVTAAVIGGAGESSTDNDTTSNKVEINNSTIVGDIYGYYSFNTADGKASNNTVTIAGDSDLTEAALYGSNREGGIGNNLIIDGWSGNVKSINNFDKIQVESLAGGLNLQAGEKTNFVTTTTDGGITSGTTIDNAEVTDMKAGVALEVDGKLVIENGNIGIEVANVKVQKQTAITTETRAAAAAFVNQGAEVVADNLNMLSQSQEGINTFATVSGNNSKYKTGSYVDINGWNTVIGIANTKEAGKDKINYGAFFENGSGNYNTYNEFDGNALRGDGNTVYNGGGVILRLDKENGFYTEAAVRAGSVKNEVGNALADTNGKTYGFETENAYYGGHIGIGKVFKLDNGKTWDVYGKYFHMHQEGDSVLIGKDRFEFDSVDSNKLRIGARFTEKQGEKLTSYYGLAWDYEFSGDVGGTANQHAMYTPSLEGSTVIGEVGFRYTPGKESPWYFDANVKGYVGMQEGLSGSVQAVYSF